MFEETFDDPAERGAVASQAEVDLDECSQGLPSEAWELEDPDAPSYPGFPLGTVAATDSAMWMLRDATRWAYQAEARRFETLLLSIDAVLAEHEQVGDPALSAAMLQRGFTIEAGAVLHVDPRTIPTLLGTARAARDSLPATWAKFQQGRFGWRSMERVRHESIGLDPDLLSAFDTQAAPFAESSTPGRLARHLTRVRERLQADTFSERARCAARGRHVSVTPLRDGQAMLSLVGPAVAIATIYDGLTTAAVGAHGHPDERESGDPRHLGALRHDIAVDLLLEGLQTEPAEAGRSGTGRSSADDGGTARVPHRRAVSPSCLVVLPAASVLGRSDDAAELAGYGPLDLDTATTDAGDAGYWTRLLTEPATGAITGIDDRAAPIPTTWRRWLHARDGTCRAPGCTRPATDCDIDHTVRREHGGPTALDNLSCLCRTHHRVKDEGVWDLRLESDGTQQWTSIWGTTHTTRPWAGVGPQPPGGELVLRTSALLVDDRAGADPPDDCPF